jgi:voltage-gated potassium channel
MLLLTLLFVAAVLTPLCRGATATVRVIAEGVEVGVWVLFVAEYLYLLALARDKGCFVRTHILDLLIVILPALRVLRVLRALRLLRLVRLASVLSAMGRALSAVRRVFGRYGLGYVALAVATILAGVSGLMLALEAPANDKLDTYPECLWWGVVTMTTVGYGDAAPVTSGGRTLAAIFMLVGIALLGVVTAAIASVFVGIERRGEDAEMKAGLETIAAEIAGLRDELRQALGSQPDKEPSG